VADHQDLNPVPDVFPSEWDRAIFTSLPSATGEGYRFVAWSNGLRLEERQELTRRAPSHGSLGGDGAGTRGLLHLRLQSSGRTGWGFVRVAGAEHTRRGGGRVWTDFLVGDAGTAARDAHHPQALRAALEGEPPPKPPIGSAALPKVGVSRRVPVEACVREGRDIARAAAVAALLMEGRPCVVAAGVDPAAVFEDAMHMVPRALRPGVTASAGLRFSLARGVKTTVTDRIDQDTLRATRGQGVECIDLEARSPAPPEPVAAWMALMQRWWGEGRAADAALLADRVVAGWNLADLPRIAAVAASVDRGELSGEALDDFLGSRSAA
jgi:hypothetical protein